MRISTSFIISLFFFMLFFEFSVISQSDNSHCRLVAIMQEVEILKSIVKNSLYKSLYIPYR